jgi:predicted outer membrane repeat protein
VRSSITKLSLAALLLPAAACVAGDAIDPLEDGDPVQAGAPDNVPDTDDVAPAAPVDRDAKPLRVDVPGGVTGYSAASALAAGRLPAYQTEEEKAHAPLIPLASYSSPPTGFMQWPYAEYGKATSVLIRADGYSATYFGQLIKAVIAAGAKPILLEPDAAGVASTKTNILTPAGIAHSSVQFEISSGVDTIWSRDYSPWYIYVDDERSSVDVRYFPDRQGDDKVPIELATRWNEDVYKAPLNTEGGNFMTDGFGTCWASEKVLDQNSGLTESAIRKIYQDYVGCSTVTFIPPIPNEGTGHIDMFSKVLNQDTILVGYSDASLGALQDEIDQLEAAALAYANTPKPGGGSWDIVRVPMRFGWDGSRVTYLTHTNSLMVNGTVLVPTYGDPTTDNVALDTYRQWLPAYKVVGIDSNSVIVSGGAIHCTTMQVPPKTFASCGDGVVTSDEDCEPTSLRWWGCEHKGYGSGTLKCTADCRWDTTQCVDGCGNGRVEGSEVCDLGAVACTTLGYDAGLAFCKADCSGYNETSCVDLPAQACTASACQKTPALAIPDANPAGIRSTITVGSFSGRLGKVKVTADITHTWRGDLTVALISPTNVMSFLHVEEGSSADDLHLSLELDDFAGATAIGDWRLEVSDGYSGDVGTLDRWSLQLLP